MKSLTTYMAIAIVILSARTVALSQDMKTQRLNAALCHTDSDCQDFTVDLIETVQDRFQDGMCAQTAQDTADRLQSALEPTSRQLTDLRICATK